MVGHFRNRNPWPTVWSGKRDIADNLSDPHKCHIEWLWNDWMMVNYPLNSWCFDTLKRLAHFCGGFCVGHFIGCFIGLTLYFSDKKYIFEIFEIFCEVLISSTAYKHKISDAKSRVLNHCYFPSNSQESLKYFNKNLGSKKSKKNFPICTVRHFQDLTLKNTFCYFPYFNAELIQFWIAEKHGWPER